MKSMIKWFISLFKPKKRIIHISVFKDLEKKGIELIKQYKKNGIQKYR